MGRKYNVFDLLGNLLAEDKHPLEIDREFNIPSKKISQMCDCGADWNVDRETDTSEYSYECPHCESKRKTLKKLELLQGA